MVGMATLYTGLVKGRTPEVLTTPVYAIQPAAGEPVAFAFDALLLPVRLDTALLSNGNYGVRVTAPSLSEAAEVFSTYITIWGVPADHSGPPANFELPQYRPSMFNPIGGPEPGVQRLPFLTNAQQCGASAPVIMSTDSWTEPSVCLRAGSGDTRASFPGADNGLSSARGVRSADVAALVHVLAGYA